MSANSGRMRQQMVKMKNGKCLNSRPAYSPFSSYFVHWLRLTSAVLFFRLPSHNVSVLHIFKSGGHLHFYLHPPSAFRLPTSADWGFGRAFQVRHFSDGTVTWVCHLGKHWRLLMELTKEHKKSVFPRQSERGKERKKEVFGVDLMHAWSLALECESGVKTSPGWCDECGRRDDVKFLRRLAGLTGESYWRTCMKNSLSSLWEMENEDRRDLHNRNRDKEEKSE